jgi:hypothetical protein
MLQLHFKHNKFIKYQFPSSCSETWKAYIKAASDLPVSKSRLYYPLLFNFHNNRHFERVQIDSVMFWQTAMNSKLNTKLNLLLLKINACFCLTSTQQLPPFWPALYDAFIQTRPFCLASVKGLPLLVLIILRTTAVLPLTTASFHTALE